MHASSSSYELVCKTKITRNDRVTQCDNKQFEYRNEWAVFALTLFIYTQNSHCTICTAS